MNNIELLKKTFSDCLAIPFASVTDDLAYNTIPEWDSTAHMILISELENNFNIMLDTDDIIDMSSVAIAKSILAKHNVSFSC